LAISSTQAVMKGREEEIAKLKSVEAQLHRTEEFAQRIVECSGDSVSVLDLEGRVEYISPPGVRALEIEHAMDLVGRRWVEFWKPQDQAQAESALAQARSGDMGSFRGDSTTARGNSRCWDVKITPARDADGRVERLIVVSRDITELRIAQQALIEAERQATAGRMAATIAHEVNNPLEAVTNFIYLAMTTNGLPETAAHHLEIADRELTRAAQITRRILGFYRGRSRNEWVRVSELIQDVITIYGRKLLDKELTTSISVDPELEVYSNDGELRQMLLNLTANAIDASYQGGKLWFRAHRTKGGKGISGGGMRITVADNGCGMSAPVKQRIFAPFFTTKSGSGTGIGLWVTKCLIEHQGGYVRFRSRQGKESGTVMTLFLPIARNLRQEIADVA
jgi:PAS domain S-box-containing protein